MLEIILKDFIRVELEDYREKLIVRVENFAELLSSLEVFEDSTVFFYDEDFQKCKDRECTFQERIVYTDTGEYSFSVLYDKWLRVISVNLFCEMGDCKVAFLCIE